MEAKTKFTKCFIVVYKEHFPTWNTLYMAFKFLGVCKFCGILHDKDVKEDGSEKKPHYHLCLWFRSYHQASYISDVFNTPLEEILPLNEYKAIPYLTHYYDKDKYQYDRFDIKYSGVNVDSFYNEDICTQSVLDELVEYILRNGLYLTDDIVKSLYEDKLIKLLEYYTLHRKMCDIAISAIYKKKGIDISKL